MKRLLLALLLACSGGGTAPAVEARLVTGAPDELSGLRAKLDEALAGYPDDPALAAQRAYVEGMGALLHGTPATASGSPARAAALGRIASGLTTATTAEQVASLAQALAGVADEEDPWYRYLAARIALLRGDRVAAMTALERIPLAPAKVDLALLWADEAKLDDARRLLPPTDPFAIVIRALLAAEEGDVAAAAEALRALPAPSLPPRLAAYRTLVDVQFALANRQPDRAVELLAKLGKQRTPPNECAFWERIAWLHLLLGRNVDRTNDHKIAGIARTRCAALGAATGDNQRLAELDANLQLGLGRPEIVRTSRARGPWGRVLRAEAELELGAPAAALPLLEGIAGAPLLEAAAAALRLEARIQLAAPRDRAPLLAQLVELARAPAFDHRAAHALGATYLAIGDLDAAQRELRAIVEQTSATRVDPRAYRTHQLLAEIALARADLATATAEAERALVIHPGNATSRVLQARIQLRAGQPERALDALAPLRKGGSLPPLAKLVVAEALVSLPAVAPDQRAQARALIGEVKGALPAAEVGRVAALVDPKLPAQLGLPIGTLPKQGI